MLAHAFGQRYDSPVPLELFVIGGASVVLLSFAFINRRGVADGHDRVASARINDTAVVARRVGRLASIASISLLGLLILAGLAGSQEVSENILPSVFWLLVWVAGPLVVGLVGDFTGPVNPFAAIARAADTTTARRLVIGRAAPLPWPFRLGWWLSGVAFFVVVVGELIVNATATVPRVVAIGMLAYGLVCAAGGLVFGSEAWIARGELFSVVFAVWGRLGWWRFGAPGRRGFAGGLDVPFDPSPSRVVGVLLLLVSVSFDGLLSTPQWGQLTARLPAGAAPGTHGYDVVAILAFAALTGLTLLVFGSFAFAAGRAGGQGGGSLVALTGLLPSLLPIAYGYLLAHYLQYVAINGQLMLPLLGNPTGSPSWPINLPYPFNDDYRVDTGVLPTSVIWYVQILVIVAAHIAAVVLAHRFLARNAFGPASARRSEWPWLVAMVSYTMVSLWLLAQPLLAETSPSDEARAARAATVSVQPADDRAR